MEFEFLEGKGAGEAHSSGHGTEWGERHYTLHSSTQDTPSADIFYIFFGAFSSPFFRSSFDWLLLCLQYTVLKCQSLEQLRSTPQSVQCAVQKKDQKLFLPHLKFGWRVLYVHYYHHYPSPLIAVVEIRNRRVVCVSTLQASVGLRFVTGPRLWSDRVA